jgi:hypothetical protein
LVAWIPDTKFNRESLARRYGKKGCHIILDKDLEKEILELAKKLPVLGEKTLTNVDLLKKKTKDQEEELAKMRKELAEIKSKDTITFKAAEDMAKKMAMEEKAELIEIIKDEKPNGGFALDQRYKDEVIPLKEKYLKQIRQDYKVLD